MSTAEIRPRRYTPVEYLEMEEKAEYKSEYLNGFIYAMSGATQQHTLIGGNVAGEIRNQFKGRPCQVYGSDMRVKVSATGLYTYPDVSAVCEKPQFENNKRTTLLNPVVVVEVLSPSTEAYDRDEKFKHYGRVGSIQEYVLIEQDHVHVERFSHRPDGWLLTEWGDLKESLELVSIGCTIALTDIYDKVEFNI